MDEAERRIAEAVGVTRVVRPPRQHLATFGVTNVHYYMVTTPSYRDLVSGEEESVIREGKAISQRPTIVTPMYMLNLEGFSAEARRYMESITHRLGPNSPGLLYRYRNEPGGMDIVSGGVPAVTQRIGEDLDKRGEDMAAVIVGADDLWDVSLLKFIYDYTAASLSSNVNEMQAMGLLEPHPDMEVPRGVVQRIERLFSEAERGLNPRMLKEELDRWGLFERYQDRFFALFRRK
ncbi:MAG: hypothetical protein HY684_04710 [Chloroflexi bacterium]|nr:hypothetical protein [Chloroflexota bacterium]